MEYQILARSDLVIFVALFLEAGLGVVTKAVTHYMALFDNILDRMGFSKFLAVVSDDLCPQVSHRILSLHFNDLARDLIWHLNPSTLLPFSDQFLEVNRKLI